jgi:hypothetical protein
LPQSSGEIIPRTGYRKGFSAANLNFNEKIIAMDNLEELTEQASTLIKSGNKVLETESEASHSQPLVHEEKFHDFRIASLSFLSRVFGTGSTYYQSFKTEVTHATASRTRRGIGTLTAAQKEFGGEWLETTRGTILKDMLTNMLKKARGQFEQENYGAAAIIAGAVIDELLCQLCMAADIKIYNEIQNKAVAKKPLQLTGDAYKKKIYDRQDNKQLIAWIELYNDAAAGKTDGLTKQKISLMLGGLQSFLAKSKF